MKSHVNKLAYCDKYDDVMTFIAKVISKECLGTTGYAIDSVMCQNHAKGLCSYYLTCSIAKAISKQVLQEFIETM